MVTLDLDGLLTKWTSAQSAWFLVKWLRIGGVSGQLRTARTDAAKPDTETLWQVLRDGLRLRAVNADLMAAAPSAQAILGLLWSKGEPSAEALTRARQWGEALHLHMLTCAGEDLVWLGQVRQLLSTLFTEGPAAYAPGTSIGSRLTRYREAFTSIEKTLAAFAVEVKLRRNLVDTAPDHFAAVRVLTDRVSTAWNQIREWCSWQKARRAAMELGLDRVIDRLESPDGATIDVPALFENLENVQGDERDVILFSICYGPDETGKVSMNFGPLNRDGGERRLNVAITRAKHEVLVFSGLRADQIDLTKTRARGVRDLKHFLDYADRGPKALMAATSASGQADVDSEFEKMVADRLRAAGYEVHHQVGSSGYRIDLAVVDPAVPGRYLLGIECDGATYHRAATARDRDKLRQLILEGLGWKLHRIWSTDWWHDAKKEMDRLIAILKKTETG